MYVRLSGTNKNIHIFIIGTETRGSLYIAVVEIYWSVVKCTHHLCITGDYELHGRVTIYVYSKALGHTVQMYKCTYVIYSRPPTHII